MRTRVVADGVTYDGANSLDLGASSNDEADTFAVCRDFALDTMHRARRDGARVVEAVVVHRGVVAWRRRSITS